MQSRGAADPLVRRFYKTVAVTDENISFCVRLDRKLLRTPSKTVLRLPTRAMAEAIAAEWRAQPEKIDPFTMPLTRLANTAIDRVEPDRPRIVEEIAKFA